MTVVKLESLSPPLIRNASFDAIKNNDPLDNKLHVVVVNSNPCNYTKRIQLAKEFLIRMREFEECIIYVVELAIDEQQYFITENNNPRHLRLHGNQALWHKENMINLGVRHLFPSEWKAMAWIDADIEFENPSWALDTLKILNGAADIVQVWSHACDMDKNFNTMKVFESFASKHAKHKKFNEDGVWHPGYGWAMTRKAWNKLGGLYDLSILGSGDYNMAMALRGQGQYSLNNETTQDYKVSLQAWERRATGLRLSYVPGVIRHHYHGSKQNRAYCERWKILVDNCYSPLKHAFYNSNGFLNLNPLHTNLLKDILKYFKERKEDD